MHHPEPPAPPPRRPSPYSPPDDFEPEYGEADWEEARSDIQVPAVILMVMSSLAFMWTTFTLATNLISPSNQGEMLLNDPNVQELIRQMPPEAAELYQNLLSTMFTVTPLTIGFNIFSLIVAVIIFLGAMRMRTLNNYGLAMASAILALIPCFGSCCCCIEIPVAIWALVLLTKDHVKNAFS